MEGHKKNSCIYEWLKLLVVTTGRVVKKRLFALLHHCYVELLPYQHSDCVWDEQSLRLTTLGGSMDYNSLATIAGSPVTQQGAAQSCMNIFSEYVE